MKVIFGSVVYKSAEKYLPDFFSSLEEQKGVSFSLLILNDDIDANLLKTIVSRYSLEIEIINCGGKTPVQLRIELLKEAKVREADLLILGDSDDFFSNTRVQDTITVYINNLDKAFFYNDVVNVDGKKLMPELPKELSDFKEIGEYNFLGLSNTAINIKKISYEFIESLKEYQYDIFDWYLFSRILLIGLCGKRVEGCNTIYRLHENNIAGIATVNYINLKREIEVKKRHYKSLKRYDVYYENKLYQYQHSDKFEILEKMDKHFWWNLVITK